MDQTEVKDKCNALVLSSEIMFDGSCSILKGEFFSTIHNGTKDYLLVKRVPNTFSDTKSLQKDLEVIVDGTSKFEYILQYFSVRLGHYLILEMEKCDISLKHHLENQPLPIKRSVEVMSQTLQGLHFLHRKEIVHGNLKPSNVLLKNNVVKLSDFGLKHMFWELREQFIENGIRIGIFDWLAPEVLECYAKRDYKPNITPEGDVFAAACVFYACLTEGRHPFGDILERGHNILYDKKVTIDKKFSLEEIEVLSVIRRMLSRDPLSRPKTVDLVTDFQRLLSGTTKNVVLPDHGPKEKIQIDPKKYDKNIFYAFFDICQIAIAFQAS